MIAGVIHFIGSLALAVAAATSYVGSDTLLLARTPRSVVDSIRWPCNNPSIANAACMGGGWKASGDSTAAIRAALATNRSLVVIHRMEGPWIVSTDGSIPGAIRGYCPRSCYALQMYRQRDITILIEPGAEIQAQRGAWHAPQMTNVPLLRIEDCHNITILAEGAKITMWKQDYSNAAVYNHSEFRFGIAVYSSSQVRVLGLNVSSTGGDGIYLEDVHDVYVKDCFLVDNFRQGMSVISAENLTVEDTVLSGTSGTWPKCGLDLEPDYGYQKLFNITFRRVVASGNAGCGFSVAPRALASRPQAISITFEDCTADGNAQAGYTFQGLTSPNITGFVKIIRGSIHNQQRVGIQFFDKNPSVLVTISQLSISSTTTNGPGEGPDPLEGWWPRAPVVFSSYPNQIHPWKKFPFGGVFFDDLSVSYSRINRSSRATQWPWLVIYHIDVHEPRKLPNPGEANITGSIKLYTETPATSCPGIWTGGPAGPQLNVSVQVECNPFY